MRVFLVLFIIWFSGLSFSQDDVLFDSANRLYNEKKYAEAIETYKSIIEKGIHSAELYHNLGNANYRLNNIGASIYYFEKALLLNPEDSEIKNNLAFAENMRIDAIDKVPEVGFSRIANSLINTFSSDTWSKIAIAGVFSFVLLFLMYHFANVTTRKRIAFITSSLGFLTACFSIFMAFQKERLDQENNPAIVFAKESRIKAEANKSSEELFRLHEGTKVQVLENYEGWCKIQLSDNSTGWILSSDIKLLNPF